MPFYPKPKLGINEKDDIAASFTEDDARRHWVAGPKANHKPDLRRNAHAGVIANQQDHGFEHLHLDVTHLIFDPPLDPPNFDGFTAQHTTEYLKAVGVKLTLTKNYIVLEKELGLDPDRRDAHKNTTAHMLAAPPIRMTLQAQNLVRLLLEGAEEIHRLMAEHPGGDIGEVPMRDYWLFWTTLRRSLAWQLPGRDEDEQLDRAGAVMQGVLEDLVDLDDE
jgi:hypothetical protein